MEFEVKYENYRAKQTNNGLEVYYTHNGTERCIGIHPYRNIKGVEDIEWFNNLQDGSYTKKCFFTGDRSDDKILREWKKAGGEELSLRDNLKDEIEALDESTIQDWWVESHTSCTHQWVEVYPDGRWYATEEPSSSTTHYVEYPDKPVASIYEIATNSSQYCDCWACKCWDDYNNDEITNEEFEREYEFSRKDMENDTFKSLVANYNHNHDVYESEVIDEILEAIDNIEYGYFEDEE